MRRIRTKSGASVYVHSPLEFIPAGSIGFLEVEYSWAKKISDGYAHDPESQRQFWEMVFNKKGEDPGYSVFQDFPLDNLARSAEPDVVLQPDSSAQALRVEDDAQMDPKSKCAAICISVIKQLKGAGAKTLEEKRKEFES